VEQLDPEVVAWVLTHGRDAVTEAAARLDQGDEPLAIGTSLRRILTGERSAFVLSAAAARLRAVAAGVDGASQLILTREAQEQASHPSVVRWRAARAGAALAHVRLPAARPLQDRCAGTGGDAVGMATHAAVLAVEQDAGRALLARDRASVLGVDVEVVVGDALNPALASRGAIVHADPDRRDATGRRARSLAQHRPSVSDLRGATGDAAGRLLTVAPGVDWADPDIAPDAEVCFLQVDRTLVEAVLCDGAAADPGTRARAVLLPEGLERTRADTILQLPVGPVGSHLLVPAVAATRARIHDAIGAEHGARRIARHRALLTSDAAIDSPWLGCEPVLAVLPGRAKALRAWLRDNPDHRVEVLLHGLDLNLRAFLRDAGRPATGPDDLRVHAIRRDDDAVLVVCGPSPQ
jgi:hypothetical protein